MKNVTKKLVVVGLGVVMAGSLLVSNLPINEKVAVDPPFTQKVAVDPPFTIHPW
jgi:hypothetical protein